VTSSYSYFLYSLLHDPATVRFLNMSVNYQPRRSFAGTVASLLSTANRAGVGLFRQPQQGGDPTSKQK